MVSASSFVRRMRGGSQSHVMLASDGQPYVVKFQNNPQHVRVLANEFLATKLAKTIGLTVPVCEVIEVADWLIDSSNDVTFIRENCEERYKSGLQFGSRLIGGLMPGQAADYLPEKHLSSVTNLHEFSGMLVLDKWTCNFDGRQAVFHRCGREKRYQATFIDQGYCFNAGEWKFIDAPLRGTYARNLVYQRVTGWDSFEPWLSKAEEMDDGLIWYLAQTIPPVWYESDKHALENLVDQLTCRKKRIRELIIQFKESSRDPFPAWRQKVAVPNERRLQETMSCTLE